MKWFKSAFATLMLTVTAFHIYGKEESAKDTIEGVLNMKEERGNVLAQGRLDGVDYRKLLREASSKHTQSLVKLFEYTGNRSLMGEGAIENGEILKALLLYLGDDFYSTALKMSSAEAKRQVISVLDEEFGFHGYSKRCPKTYALASHERKE